MRTMDILMYFMLTCCATVIGVCYAMALETLRRKNLKLFWAYILSILVTPVGAWVVSTLVRGSEPLIVQPAPPAVAEAPAHTGQTASPEAPQEGEKTS